MTKTPVDDERAERRGAVAGARRMLPRQIEPIWIGVIFLALVTLFVTQSRSSFDMYTLNTVFLAILGALALNVLMGTAGQASIGNAAFLAVGAFSEAFFVRSELLPFPLSVVASALIAALVGVMVGIPALRLTGLYLILTTLAAHFIVLYVVGQYQENAKGAENGFFMLPIFLDRGLDKVQIYWAWTLFAIVSIAMLGASRIMRHKVGRALRLIRDHELIAPTLGIQTTQYKLMIFALTSAVIGLQGALLARFTGAVTVEAFTFALAVQYIAMIFIGGLDSIAGAVIGATIVTYLPVMIPDVVSVFAGAENAASYTGNVSLMVYGLLIMVFIVSSPNGIVGLIERVRDQLRKRRRLERTE